MHPRSNNFFELTSINNPLHASICYSWRCSKASFFQPVADTFDTDFKENRILEPFASLFATDSQDKDTWTRFKFAPWFQPWTLRFSYHTRSELMFPRWQVYTHEMNHHTHISALNFQLSKNRKRVSFANEKLVTLQRSKTNFWKQDRSRNQYHDYIDIPYN